VTRASEVCVSAMAMGHSAGFAAAEDANLGAERLVAPLRSRDKKLDFVPDRDRRIHHLRRVEENIISRPAVSWSDETIFIRGHKHDESMLLLRLWR